MAKTSPESETVILLHGLWMGRGVMRYLRNRLRADAPARQVLDFEYPSMQATLEENADALAAFAASVHAGRLHFVGHSLGGVIILHMLNRQPPGPGGRVVCLGSPLCGSAAARNVLRMPLGKAVLGNAMRQAINGGLETWSGERELGIIAGSVGLGLGMLTTHLPSPHDGSVSVAETRLAGAADHMVVGVNHMGLLFSAEVAEQTDQFLKTGHFRRD